MATRPNAARGKTTRKEKLKRQVKKFKDQFGKLPKPRKLSPGENLARFGSVTGPKKPKKRGIDSLRRAMASAAAGTAGKTLKRAASQLKKGSR